jgi:hypothetical protein
MSQSTRVENRTLDLITLLGPEDAAKMTRPLTSEESAMVNEALARHDGDPISALGVNHLPEDVKAEMRRVFASAR